MDRPQLDKLYLGSRGKPARVFKRAASEEPIAASTYGFLLDHVEELDLDVLIRILEAKLAPEVEISEKPFLRRVATLLPATDVSHLLRVLKLSSNISSEALFEHKVKVGDIKSAAGRNK